MQLKRKLFTFNAANEYPRNKNAVIGIAFDAFIKTGVLQET
jgi:hypothetical protein